MTTKAERVAKKALKNAPESTTSAPEKTSPVVLVAEPTTRVFTEEELKIVREFVGNLAEMKKNLPRIAKEKKDRKPAEPTPLVLSAILTEKEPVLTANLKTASMDIQNALTILSERIRDHKDEESLENLRLFVGRLQNRFTYCRSQLKAAKEENKA